MAKAFSVASGNVEHFKDVKKTKPRVDRVVKFVENQDPDVFALYEVEGKDVFTTLVASMPRYSFFITEGQQVQEIMIGVKPSLTAFFTQRTEFKGGVTLLRPGALLTITVEGTNYPLLFLHTKSGNDPRGLGLRDDMVVRAFDFRKVLDKAPGAAGRANFVFLGDLNTMGMNYAFVGEHDIPADGELLKIERQARARKMRVLTKNAPATWSNGPTSSIPPSNLDHVVAADHLQFKLFGGAEVDVRGWPTLSEPQQSKWLGDYSDHALLYFEMQRT